MMRTYKILIIEDSKVFSKLVTSLLEVSEDFQFKTKIATSLSEATDELHRCNYDAVILDLTLPDSLPEHTFDTISDMIPETPIIVSTSSTSSTWALNALRKGAQDYVPKSGLTSEIICNAIVYGIERKRIMLESIETETVLKRNNAKLANELEAAREIIQQIQRQAPVEEASKPPLVVPPKVLSKDEMGPVLVVDDIDVNLTIATLLLKKCGIKDIVVAKNGEEAIQKWKEGHYNMIFMDIHMPVMDGITATSMIRKSDNGNAQPFILALSAALNETLVEACMDSGMNKVLTKPITIDKMKEAISELLVS